MEHNIYETGIVENFKGIIAQHLLKIKIGGAPQNHKRYQDRYEMRSLDSKDRK